LQIAINGLATFLEVTDFHSPIIAGFGINKAGEQLLLSYAPGGSLVRVVDAFQFKGQEKGVPIGRVPDDSTYWVSILPAANSPNVKASQQPIISEIMYHPVDASGKNAYPRRARILCRNAVSFPNIRSG